MRKYILLSLCVLFVSSCAKKSAEDRFIDDLLSRMTLEEKIGQLNQLDPSWNAEEKEALIREGKVGSIFNIVGAKEVNRLQRMAVEETRLGIPLVAARDVIHGFRTICPIPLGQGATWNPALVEQAAQLTAQEAVQFGIRWAFSPMVDVAHDPRWGRVAEGYGEDPVLTSTMGAATVRGYQSPSPITDNPSPMMAACVKHFAGYSASEGGRDYNTTWIPEVQLRDIYLPPFKAALDAGAMSVMCSFNNMNGFPSSANPHLNIDILRHEWQSDALLVSDWGSGSDLVPHGMCADKKDAALRCINARMEMDMQGNIYTDYLAALVDSGLVRESQIDECVRSVLRLKYRLGLFENPYVPEDEPIVCTPEASAVCTRLVEESAILLKNDGILPLTPNPSPFTFHLSPFTILITGPLAHQKKEQLGTWVFDGDTSLSITPLEAFRTSYTIHHTPYTIIYEPGLTFSRDKDMSHVAKAVAAAKKADIILYFCGEEAILSGEARCRADLNLPGAQIQMMDALVATGKPVVMVVMAGRPLTIGRQVEQAAAVLYAFHGGTMAGPGLANVLTGKAVPSGRLPITFPKMVGQIPLYYNRHNTGRPSYDPPMLIDSIPIGCPQFSIGQSSYWLETPTEPLFPFGFGLSYTTFEYGSTRIDTLPFREGHGVGYSLSCAITNTGKTDAYEVAQLYTHQKSGYMVRPLKELKGFEKVFIPAGESRTVTFTLTEEQLGYWHEKCESDNRSPITAHRYFFATDAAEYELWIAPDSRCQTTPVQLTLK
ncbi:MAG: glycoside hydrolase family 3 C-terminal domain-containing protein [Paludibacteraceae bacterium]|nr:glycoside hydrolase family 3 C-terminal domain-containing protein [Paludibacteraceae bacterium]